MNNYMETIWCDDIRHEVGGKFSLIGIYTGALFVPKLPLTLPKLCLVLRIITPLDFPWNFLRIRVLKGDTVLGESSMPENQLQHLRSLQKSVPDDGQEEHILMSTSQFIFQNLYLDAPCTLKARAITELGEIKGQGLRVMQSPAPQDGDIAS